MTSSWFTSSPQALRDNRRTSVQPIPLADEQRPGRISGIFCGAKKMTPSSMYRSVYVIAILRQSHDRKASLWLKPAKQATSRDR